MIIGESGVDFGEGEIGILADDFFGRPATTLIVADDHGDAGAGVVFEARGFIRGFYDVRICERGWHDEKVAVWVGCVNGDLVVGQ